ncbi:hypothetical protein C7B65_18365 [Phormidesmis priestleyi ULC007]|uniref:Uncharacterized protein n=1 Tax=Phormidesmis priestleyi ULC007 TaxID=1920490 RepID=A0A2T1DAP5_9CYAN|nr:hypothetical protein [Phormidesmis priestleyi]PSB17513.1 hypothetical protein C7B65_18365 [Phormidesmis priestleyi ULC007]PZO47258.1 MAG: hypothetical protein DCF14_20385 [Phormidesmis priestleyi]
MRINSTVALTFILLTLMFGAGIVTGAWGFAIGREALKGITQPDARPTNKVGKKNGSTRTSDALVVLQEDDIIKKVKTRLNGNAKSATASIAPPKPEPEKQVTNSAKFPIVSQDKGVTVEVSGVRRRGDSVVFDVSMKNEGSQSVKFLYSFLNITDEQGRVLSADTDGLPTELPPNNQKFTGTVSLSTALLDKAQKISIQLTDYPDQKLQLRMADIPVK